MLGTSPCVAKAYETRATEAELHRYVKGVHQPHFLAANLAVGFLI